MSNGAVENVYYGAKRVDAKGTTKYKIGRGGIEEERDGSPRMLILYDWRGRTYGCVDNVGDLDELDGAEGTCPYEIVATLPGNHAGKM